MTQLPAGATDPIATHERDLGPGCFPGGVPGIQTRHSPAFGRCPGGTPSVAAVLGPRLDSADADADPDAELRCWGLGSTITVFVVLLQPASQRLAPMSARRCIGDLLRKGRPQCSISR